MLPALRTSKAWGQAGKPQKKLILILASEGYIINQWRPKIGSLMDQTLPSSSSPLEPYKSYVNFLHPLTNPSYRGAISGHQAYATIFWGGPNGGGQYPEPTGPTLDQVVAGALKPDASASRWPSRCRSTASRRAAAAAPRAASTRGPARPSTPS